MANTCRRCGQALSTCSTCKGTGRWSHLGGSDPCPKCKATGFICPNASHGPNWQ